MSKSQTREYMSKSGRRLYKPSIELVMLLNENSQGFCLACANEQEGVEPDGKKYLCDECGEMKVYGAEEIALMGLTF